MPWRALSETTAQIEGANLTGPETVPKRLLQMETKLEFTMTGQWIQRLDKKFGSSWSWIKK